MKTPSTELHAVEQDQKNGDGVRAPDRKTDTDTLPEPPWVEELRRLLQQQGKRLENQGKRIERIERQLKSLDGSLTVLGNSYKVQAKELQLLREACPACDAEEIVTAEGSGAATS